MAPFVAETQCQVEKMPDKREVPIGEAMRGTPPPPPWEQGRNCIHVLWEVSVKRIYLRWHRRLSRSDLTKLWPGLLLGLSKFG